MHIGHIDDTSSADQRVDNSGNVVAVSSISKGDQSTIDDSNEKKRKRDGNQVDNSEIEIINESSTIDDLATIDASTYIAWVNRQSRALPNVFVAELSEVHGKTQIRGQEDPIDGSAATLQVLLSKQMVIRPPPTVRHLPPIDSQIQNSTSNDVKNRHSTTNACKCSNWISSTISNFSELRSQLEKAQSQMNQQQRKIAVPRMKDRAAWHVFCLGKEEARGNIGGFFEDSDDEEEKEDTLENDFDIEVTKQETSLEDTVNGGKTQQQGYKSEYNPHLVPPNGYPPTLSLLLQFDQVLTRFLFHHHIHFFCEWESPLTRNRAAWIYALLARMEKPWHREECSAVRRLLRECCARRWELTLPDVDCKPEYNNDSIVALPMDVATPASDRDGELKTWELLAMLNTIIAVTGLYYEQGSMAGGDGIDSLFTVSDKDDSET
jgi:survival of motor neuron protein-interacting protein 1